MRLKSLTASTLALLLVVSNVAFAKSIDGNDVIKNPSKQLKDSGTKLVSGSKRIIVPSAEIRFLWAGDAFAGQNEGMASAHVRVKYAVTGLTKADAQGMAKSVYDDLIKKLRAAGWDVLTYDDIKAEVADLERWKAADPEVGMALYNDPRYPGEAFAIAAPSDEQAFKPALQGYGWALRKVAKDKDATLFYPVFTVRCPRPQAEGSKSTSLSTVELKASLGLPPFLAFTPPNGAILWVQNEKGAGGAVQAVDFFRMTEHAGISEEVGEDSPEFKGKISWLYKAVVSGFNDDDPKSRANKKSAFHLVAFRVDKPVYTEAVLKFTAAFNDVVARTAAAYKK